MTNKQHYRSVVINGVEYALGQAVRVQSSSDEPYRAIIHKLWENEQGEKQVVARWLLRRSEMFLSKKAVPAVDAEPSEVFYSNADDLITPGMILGPLRVVSHSAFAAARAASPKPARAKGGAALAAGEACFCRRYFNEQSAVVGALDWDAFYGSERMLDPAADAELFKAPVKRGPRDKAAATLAGRAKAAARRQQDTQPRTPARGSSPGSKRPRREAGGSDVDGGDSDSAGDNSDSDYAGSDGAEEASGRTRATPSGARARRAAPSTPARARRGTMSRGAKTPATPATAARRRVRLQDIQPAAVSTAVLRRASRVGTGPAGDALQGLSIYEAARSRLHVSAVPDTLPCREDEFAEIYGHLYTSIAERNSMCLYISGVPGTGKTATVHEVIRALRESAEEGDLPEF
ncbi:Origin recognition complex, subunit 1, partial [Coemansia helicoidea]